MLMLLVSGENGEYVECLLTPWNNVHIAKLIVANCLKYPTLYRNDAFIVVCARAVWIQCVSSHYLLRISCIFLPSVPSSLVVCPGGSDLISVWRTFWLWLVFMCLGISADIFRRKYVKNVLAVMMKCRSWRSHDSGWSKTDVILLQVFLWTPRQWPWSRVLGTVSCLC
jgi:hypothetical protein